MFSIRPGGSAGNGQYARYPQMNHKEIVSFIEQHAVSIRYWKATSCPCKNLDTGQPDVRCQYCRGLGWYHESFETDEKYLKAQIHSRSSRNQQQKGGNAVMGQATATFLPGLVPCDGDLIQVCVDTEAVNDEIHIYGSLLNDRSTAERLRYRDVRCVEKVVVYNATTATPRTLEQSKWSFDSSARRIVFQAGVLSQGDKYSVRYLARPEYIVMGETVRPTLRVAHDENQPVDVRFDQDIIYPYGCEIVRHHRALSQRMRGDVDNRIPTTYNQHQGPFR